MAIIQIDNVGKFFPNTEKWALKGIHLEISEGEFVCIVGPSGCGKSTLLHIIAGFEQPTEGKVLIDGHCVSGPSQERLMLFQESALYPWLNVEDNIRLGMEFAGIEKKEQEKRLEKYLRMVKLWEFRKYAIHELSGGMKQRAGIARALSLDGKVLLMDEPFSALDKQTINSLRAELEEIWQQTRKTILYVTHSVEEALYFADRVIILSENPATIKDVIVIDLARPRHIESEEFLTIRKRLLGEVREEVSKIAENEYDKE